MRKIFFCTLLSILVLNAFAQSCFIDYYQLLQEGRHFRRREMYQEALEKHHEAIGLVPTAHRRDYLAAAELSTLNKRYNEASVYIIQSIRKGTTMSELLKDEVLIPYRKQDTWKHVKSIYDSLHRDYEAGIKREYVLAIDNLYKLDQKVRQKGDSIEVSDHRNMEIMLGLIQQYGFPKEDLVGEDGYRNAAIVLHHGLLLPAFFDLHEQFKSYIDKGWYRPEDFARMHDMVQIRAKVPQLYHQIPPTAQELKNLTIPQREIINAARVAIGLSTLERYQVSGVQYSTRNQVKK